MSEINALADLKVGDRVQVFDVNGPRMGQPKGGWDGTVVKVGRKLITVKHGGWSTQVERSMPELIIVTRTWEDGGVQSWRQENGDTEANMRRRMRASGRQHRDGPGWIEWDHEVDGLSYTERLEWPGGESHG